MSAAIRERVLRGIALNREPGFFFSGNFLGLTFDTIATRDMRVSVETGPHCADRDGQANFAVLAMLADMALAGCIRAGLTLTTRLKPRPPRAPRCRKAGGSPGSAPPS